MLNAFKSKRSLIHLENSPEILNSTLSQIFHTCFLSVLVQSITILQNF